jgi:hypothetical protein
VSMASILGRAREFVGRDAATGSGS